MFFVSNVVKPKCVFSHMSNCYADVRVFFYHGFDGGRKTVRPDCWSYDDVGVICVLSDKLCSSASGSLTLAVFTKWNLPVSPFLGLASLCIIPSMSSLSFSSSCACTHCVQGFCLANVSLS